MQTNETSITYRNPRSRFQHADQLRWLDMSFTGEGYRILCDHRRRLSVKEGRSVPLGYALDDLIKSHTAAPEVER